MVRNAGNAARGRAALDQLLCAFSAYAVRSITQSPSSSGILPERAWFFDGAVQRHAGPAAKRHEGMVVRARLTQNHLPGRPIGCQVRADMPGAADPTIRIVSLTTDIVQTPRKAFQSQSRSKDFFD
jgi:hypothetical protein